MRASCSCGSHGSSLTASFAIRPGCANATGAADIRAILERPSARCAARDSGDRRDGAAGAALRPMRSAPSWRRGHGDEQALRGVWRSGHHAACRGRPAQEHAPCDNKRASTSSLYRGANLSSATSRTALHTLAARSSTYGPRKASNRLGEAKTTLSRRPTPAAGPSAGFPRAGRLPGGPRRELRNRVHRAGHRRLARLPPAQRDEQLRPDASPCCLVARPRTRWRALWARSR